MVHASDFSRQRLFLQGIKLIVFLCAMILASLVRVAPIHAATFSVNETGDQSDFSPGDGVCDRDNVSLGSQCTLRSAIQEANALAGNDSIHFNIPTTDSGYRDYDSPNTVSSGDGLDGDDYWTIRYMSIFPQITEPLIIDGSTQSSNQGDRNTNGPEIEISGRNLAFVSGFTLNFTPTAVGSSLNDLVITHALTNTIPFAQIRIAANNFILTNSYISTDIKSLALPGVPSRGVYVDQANGVVLGNNINDGNVFGGIAQQVQVACGSGVLKDITFKGNNVALDVSGMIINSNGVGEVNFIGNCNLKLGGDSVNERNLLQRVRIGDGSGFRAEIYNNYFGTKADGSIYPGTIFGLEYGGLIDEVIVGDNAKGNLFRGYLRALRGNGSVSCNQIRIGYNTFADNRRQAMGLNGSGSCNFNVTHNYFGISTADPYFNLSTGANGTDNNTGSVNIIASQAGNSIIQNNKINGQPFGDQVIQILPNVTSLEVKNNDIRNTNTKAIAVSANSGVTIQNNVISNNSLLGIDLLGGSENIYRVTANDLDDLDSGANNLQNFPTISKVEYLGGGIYLIDGSIDGNSSEAPFEIEVCESDNHVSNHGGCIQSLGMVTSTANWQILVTIAGSDGYDNRVFTTLATNTTGSTSEFGGNFLASLTNPNYTIRKYPINLIYPRNGVEVMNKTPMLDWAPSQDLDLAKYEVYFGRNSSNLKKIAELNKDSTYLYLTSALTEGRYYWKIRGVRVNGTESGVSQTTSFSVVAPPIGSAPQVILIYPSPGGEIDETKPNLMWTVVSNTNVVYTEVYLSKECGQPLAKSQLLAKVTAQSYQLETELELGEYCWEVVIYGSDGKEIARSKQDTFKVGKVVVEKPIDLPVSDKVDLPSPSIGILASLIPLIAAIVSALLGATVLGSWKGTIYRAFSLFGVLFLNRESRLVVYDKHNHKPIPFAEIAVSSGIEGRDIIQAITDQTGKLNLKLITGRHLLEVNANGFLAERRDMQIDSSENVSQEFFLVRVTSISDLQKILYFYKRQIINTLQLLIVGLVLVGLGISLYATMVNPVAFNFTVLVLYIVSFLLNSHSIWQRIFLGNSN